MASGYQLIQLAGTATERGIAYGTQAKAQIDHTLSFYRSMFQTYGVTWDRAKAVAQDFVPIIEDYYAEGLEEMQGIACGAGVGFEDILALNCRSEILFALPDGCSCVGVLPERTSNGHTLLGQTWDWLAPARDSTVILEVSQAGFPKILMVAEAGIIGGKGLNDCGIGVCLNATSVGHGGIGVPLHIMYRQVLNSDIISNALDKVAQPKRAGSGTFNIGSSDGFLMSVEFTPDNFDVLMSTDTPLIHTNHYLSPLFRGQDIFKRDLTDTFVRLNRLKRLSATQQVPYTTDTLFSFFADHANYPDSVCSHEDPKDAPGKALSTVYAIAMDLNEHRLLITDGSPCEGKIHNFALA